MIWPRASTRNRKKKWRSQSRVRFRLANLLSHQGLTVNTTSQTRILHQITISLEETRQIRVATLPRHKGLYVQCHTLNLSKRTISHRTSSVVSKSSPRISKSSLRLEMSKLKNGFQANDRLWKRLCGSCLTITGTTWIPHHDAERLAAPMRVRTHSSTYVREVRLSTLNSKTITKIKCSLSLLPVRRTSSYISRKSEF